LVTDDPSPLATLEDFGDGTLEFVLRCYLPNMDNRLASLHELHSAVYRAFRNAGIELAAPKQDIRISTAEQEARFAGRE
jgi:potassium efflux system protein